MNITSVIKNLGIPIFVVLLVFGTVVMSGCVDTGNSNPSTAPQNKILGDSLLACSNEMTDILRTSCYSELAVSKGDPSICKNLEDYVLGMNNCYSEVAQDKNDETICMMIDGEHPQTICLIRIGKQKNDPSVCDNLETETWKKQCVAAVSG